MQYETVQNLHLPLRNTVLQNLSWQNNDNLILVSSISRAKSPLISLTWHLKISFLQEGERLFFNVCFGAGNTKEAQVTLNPKCELDVQW